MHRIKEESYKLSDLKKAASAFSGYITKGWWILLLMVTLGACLGLMYYKIQKPKYQAETTFVLEEKSSGGGLAGLASQFGFNLGSLTGGGSILSGDNILEVLKSKKVVYQVLLSKVDSIKGGTTLADLYLNFTGKKKNWQKRPHLSGMRFTTGSNHITPLQDSVLNLFYEDIVKNNLVTERTRKQGTIIRVQVTASNSTFARLMAERLVNEASMLYLNIRIGNAMDNIYQLQRRSDSLLYLLNQKSYRAAASQTLDLNPGLRTAIVPVEIATRDKAIIGTIYTEVTKNLEASKLLLSQQTPIIQLMDRPAILLDDHKKGRLMLIMVFSFVAAFAYLLIALFLFLFFGTDRKQQPAL